VFILLTCSSEKVEDNTLDCCVVVMLVSMDLFGLINRRCFCKNNFECFVVVERGD
jgi:hypothetical protein